MKGGLTFTRDFSYTARRVAISPIANSLCHFHALPTLSMAVEEYVCTSIRTLIVRLRRGSQRVSHRRDSVVRAFACDDVLRRWRYSSTAECSREKVLLFVSGNK